MQQEFFEVEKERFDLSDPCIYHLQGTWPKECDAEAYLDGKKIPVQIEKQERVSALERFQDLDLVNGIRIRMEIHLPENLCDYKKLKIYGPGKKFLWFSIPVKQLLERQRKPQYYIENVDIESGVCRVRGWAVYKEPLLIYLEEKNGNRISCEMQRLKRVDVQNQYTELDVEEKCGFFFELKYESLKEFYIVFCSGNIKLRRLIHLQPGKIAMEKAGVYYRKGTRYLKAHGPLALTQKVAGKVKTRNKAAVIYQKWLPRHLPTKKDLERQRQEKFSWEPMFSVVVPLYKTPEKYLRALVESLQRQTYSNWELCLSDGSGKDSPIREVLEDLKKSESRIKVIYHQESLQIAQNTNAAIEAASGDFIVFADHDDELTDHALYECVKVLNENRDIEVIYSDEDKMTMDGHKFFQPHFKPDFNIDLLCTVNYICHLFVAKKELIDRVGMLRKEFDGAQDYDFIFRCVEAAGDKKICHIPKILYHWRCHEDSTSENPESKLYAFDAGQRAVQAHYDRIGVPVEITKGEFLGLYRTKFLIDHDPLISIIIPNKDHIDDLKRCMDSIEKKSTYRNFEFIIVENNSEKQETFAYYQQLEAINPKVHVVYWKDKFNYSAINNFGVQYAKGDYILLLNNDTEIINDDCLEELLGYCTRVDVGAVGARLYYEDDTIQHAGVVIGFGGIAGHCFVQQKRGFTGYCHRIICAQDYSAVTAACMMVKKEAFEKVGGLTEAFEVAFNDIDFCLKLGKAGYHVVYNPYAELYHYESKSRGLEDTPEKVARFNREIAEFEKRWPEILRDGDPYYNPNLTLDSQDFSLRRI
ncbi:MAG: glycosyltransferase family 2 protein [Oliverpabstia sp.]|nr:glycosyltransferase family 2 protein [Eubacterium sp.]MDY2596313.1 glycosyltransferase family 2 protein [Oliverpabstia sp.]